MGFHNNKCKLLRITNKSNHTEAGYVMHVAKYLGILIHKMLSWKSHINSIIKKANQTEVSAMEYQTMSSWCQGPMLPTYVRPIVEYASSVWDIVGEGNLILQNILEMVQRQAARFVYNDWKTTSSLWEMIIKKSGKV